MTTTDATSNQKLDGFKEYKHWHQDNSPLHYKLLLNNECQTLPRRNELGNLTPQMHLQDPRNKYSHPPTHQLHVHPCWWGSNQVCTTDAEWQIIKKKKKNQTVEANNINSKHSRIRKYYWLKSGKDMFQQFRNQNVQITDMELVPVCQTHIVKKYKQTSGKENKRDSVQHLVY